MLSLQTLLRQMPPLVMTNMSTPLGGGWIFGSKNDGESEVTMPSWVLMLKVLVSMKMRLCSRGSTCPAPLS